MKETYVEVEMEIIEFESEDIITNSLPFTSVYSDEVDDGESDY